MAPEPTGRNNDHMSDSLGDVHGLSRERPWLLPSNRKLRALQGISLRNLSLARPLNRPRGQTIDDESLPNSLQSPGKAKALALRESHKLEHSRSSNDLRLRSSNELNSGSPKKQVTKDQNSSNIAASKHRPTRGKLRRSSTLNWTNSSPRSRQQRLEDVIAERMADTFFSLHCEGIPKPIYVSEVIEKSMNPSFRFFDLKIYGPLVTRQDELTIKLWARTEAMEEYTLLIELRANLRSLQFIGKSLDSFHHPLPPNCILFHLVDGIYTSFTDLPPEEPAIPVVVPAKTNQTLQPTSSFDALMRLSNLDDCIQDALATREKLSTQISQLLADQKRARDAVTQASQAEEHLAATNRALATCRQQVKTAQRKRSEIQASLKTRRAAIASGQLAQHQASTDLAASPAALLEAATRLKTVRTALSGQIRRICEDLLITYPIESIDPKSLSYSIRGLHLPNANTTSPHPDTNPDAIAAALGLVAHITELLSLYLSTPIPYPPIPHGSTSTIIDPISNTMPSQASRTFPLYQKGAVTYRFEYGVFLLNSDIELLMSRQGARMVDLRHTLPNLKYVLTVLTAGKGDLPVRKRGDVRGLENGKAAQGQVMNDDADAPEKVLHANANGKALQQI